MVIEVIKATRADAEIFVEVQNKSFYQDYMKYGECLGYGRTAESVAEVMERNSAYKILADGEIIGKVSARENENGDCHLDCLCVIPEYENRGIGRQAVSFIEKQFPKAKNWSLETPADNSRNRYFYEQCGYSVVDKMMDGNVEIVILGK